MDPLQTLRDALKKHLAETNALLVKATSEGATMADIEALEKANEQTALMERQIQTVLASQAAVARSAQPLDAPAAGSVPASPAVEMSKAARMGILIKAMVTAHHEHIPVNKALEDNGFGALVADVERAKKELITTTPSAGGVTIPQNLSDQLIEMLRPVSAFAALQPRNIDLPNGNLTIPRQDTGVQGGYVAESTDIGVEQPTFGAMTFAQKKLAVIVPISNELLTWSPINMENVVRTDISAGLGQKMDLALLRGDGANGSPLGIANKVGIQTFTANSTVTIQNIELDLMKMELVMDNAPLPEQRRVWVMAPRTFLYLQSLRDGNGQPVYPELRGPNPVLRSKPVLRTTQIPINLGAGTNASEVYLVEASEVWFATPPGAQLQFAVSTEAMYKVGGVSYSAFQRDVTLIRGITHHDTDIRRIAAVVKLTGVTWGA